MDVTSFCRGGGGCGGVKQKITRKRKKETTEKQTNKQTNQTIMTNKNKEITAKAEDLLDLRVSVHSRERNCSARD